MIRRPRGEYSVRAYLLSEDGRRVFWCKLRKRRSINTEVGTMMESGQMTLETEADIEFKINQRVQIGDEVYTVEEEPDTFVRDKDMTAYRKPRFVTKLVVS